MPQDYTATIFLRQRWTDERLVFEGNKSLSLDGRLVELLWVPDTFIVDSKKSFLHDITVENRLIRIFPNGTVLYALRWGIWVDFPLTGGPVAPVASSKQRLNNITGTMRPVMTGFLRLYSFISVWIA